MTSCVPFEEINAFVDGQLGPAAEVEVRRHLDVCSDCGAAVEALLALKDAVAASAEVRAVPHTLRERLGTLPRPRGWIWRLGLWRMVGLAAAVLLAVGVSRWVLSPGRSSADPVSEAFVADHLHFLQAPDAIEVSSDDPERLAAWFDGKIGFTVRVPQLRAAALLGGRLCSLWGHKVALAFYEARGRRLSLFTLDADALPAGAQRGNGCAAGLGDYHVCLLPAPPVVLAMVGDAEQAAMVLPELQRFAASRP